MTILVLLCLALLAGPPLWIHARVLTDHAQASAGSNGVIQEGTPGRTLESGQSVARDMKGGESHSYRVALDADQYLSAVVDERGVDVMATLVGPDGTKQVEANDAKGGLGSETLTFIAEAGGDYRLDVVPAERNAAAGRYHVSIVALRAPTSDERALEQARRSLAQSRDLRQKGKYDEALPPAERALAIREKVLGPDHRAVADALHLLAVIYDDKHDYAKAEAPNLRALAIREKALGPDHPDVARSLFNLAWLAKMRQDFGHAESLYRPLDSGEGTRRRSRGGRHDAQRPRRGLQPEGRFRPVHLDQPTRVGDSRERPGA